MMNRVKLDNAVVILVLVTHLGWILWVIFGAFWTRGRPWLRAFHIVSLIWGIIVEAGPWPCPLTLAEDFFQRRSGQGLTGGNFLQHYISSIVYPDVSVTLLTICGIAVCVANLGIYAWRAYRCMRLDSRPS